MGKLIKNTKLRLVTYLFVYRATTRLLHHINMLEPMGILFSISYKYSIASNPDETRVRIVKALY